MADETSKSREKKRTYEVEESDEESTSESSESHSEDESEDIDAEEIPVEFEAFSPTEQAFDGIRNLLQQLFLKSAIDLSKLSNLIISQPEISSIIKVVNDDEEEEDDIGDSTSNEEDDRDCDIFGITTVLNFKQQKDDPCVQQIKKLLLEKCQECADDETRKKFEVEFLNDKKKTLGFLINERFINIPPQIALPLFKTLRSELESGEQKGKQPRLDHLLMLCKSYKAVETKDSKSKKVKKAKKQDEDLDELQFSNIEDKLFQKEAVLSFSYPASTDESETIIAGKWSYDDAVLRPYRTVMVVPYSKIHAVLSAMDQMLQ